jgi:hypothetical protein
VPTGHRRANHGWLANAENVLRIPLIDEVGSRCIELVIDQRLHFFYKLLRVRLADMIIECGLIHPARVNVEQPRIPDRAERMNAQTTRLVSGRCNDFAKRGLDTSFLTRPSVKARKDEQFRNLFPISLPMRFLGILSQRR